MPPIIETGLLVAALLVAIALGVTIIQRVRDRLLAKGAGSDPESILAPLRAAREQGELDEAEYQRARAALDQAAIRRAASEAEAARPAPPSRPVPSQTGAPGGDATRLPPHGEREPLPSPNPHTEERPSRLGDV